LNDDDPDAELLARIGRGEPEAMRELVARKLARLVALAERLLGRRGEAEDVAQEVFVRAWKQAARWQPGNARVDTWLHRVALNLCYDRLRARRDEEPYDESHDAIADVAPIPEQALQARQRRDRVAAALARLPARQREALVLQYYQELSNREAAALMEVGIEALESLLARARRSLRAQLMNQEIEKP
jgi:RNA polymerase sigma-70 factor (ECF subfamily)